MPSHWTAAEDAALRDAVRVHGCRWREVARTLATSRTDESVRRRWERHVRGRSPTAVSSVQQVALGGTAGELQWLPLPPVLKLPRSRSGGRPWDYYVRPSPAGRQRTGSYRQALQIRLWKLDQPAPRLFLCNLKHAEGVVRRRLAKTLPAARLRVALNCTPQPSWSPLLGRDVLQ